MIRRKTQGLIAVLVVVVALGTLELVGLPKSGYHCGDFRTEVDGWVYGNVATAWISPITGKVRRYTYTDSNGFSRSYNEADSASIICEPAEAKN